MKSEDRATSNIIDGGIQQGLVVQARDINNPTFITNLPAQAAPVALAQLPALVTGFTGRDAELAQIAGMLDPAAAVGAVVMSAVEGLAGVGKTSLAVHAAHAARQAGWFPGGALFIDLHGYDQNPVQPRQALDALLRALGVPIGHIPEDVEQRAAVYRSYLAQSSGPMLIIADNASAEAQVRPLLPGPGPHRVVITSRHTLASLGARVVDVTVLDQVASLALLDAVLRAARPADDRIISDQDAAEKLAEACGGLPLALQITAALLIADSTLTAAELADDLTDEVRRLETLHYDDGSGSGAPSVAAAFGLSYRQLDQEAARMFRLLSADPGPDVSTEAAGVLADWERAQTRTVLGRLKKAHLVEVTPGTPGRWRMHDLLRLYAREIPNDGEREQAVGRLFAWYLRRTHMANLHLMAQPGMPIPADFTGFEAALTWLDTERLNLIAVVVLAADIGEEQVAIRLAPDLFEYLLRRRRFDDLLTVLDICRGSAGRLGDVESEILALDRRGVALMHAGRFEEAISAHKEAAADFRKIGDQQGAAVALGHLAGALGRAGRLNEAISAGEEAAADFRERGDQRGVAMALTNLGGALRQAERAEEAATAFSEAAVIYRQAGSQHGWAMALGNLGGSLRDAGKHKEAISVCAKAVEIFRQTGDQHSVAVALGNLGLLMQETGRLQGAISAFREAVEIVRQTGDQHGMGEMLGKLGEALRETGQHKEAISVLQKAVAITRKTDDRRGLSRMLFNLSTALRDTDRIEAADTVLLEAAAIFEEIGGFAQ